MNNQLITSFTEQNLQAVANKQQQKEWFQNTNQPLKIVTQSREIMHPDGTAERQQLIVEYQENLHQQYAPQTAPAPTIDKSMKFIGIAIISSFGIISLIAILAMALLLGGSLK